MENLYELLLSICEKIKNSNAESISKAPQSVDTKRKAGSCTIARTCLSLCVYTFIYDHIPIFIQITVFLCNLPQ